MTARQESLIRELRARRGLHASQGGGVRRKPRGRIPPQLQPDHIRLVYFQALRRGPLALIRSQVEKLQGHLPAMVSAGASAVTRHDADDDPNEVVDDLRDAWVEEFTSRRAAEIIQPIGLSINEFQGAQFAKQIKHVTGVDLVRSEGWLGPKIQAFTKENVALIKSIGAQFYPDLEKRLAAGIADGLRQEELADMIEERYGVAESRAALIARDQVGKFFGDVNEARQAELGITRYTWRTAEDNRVREEHEERDGEVYSWDDPPEDDDFGPVNPGDAINCRCTAEPLLDDVFDAVFGDDEG